MSKYGVIIICNIRYTSIMKKLPLDFVVKVLFIALAAFVVLNFPMLKGLCGKIIGVFQPIFIGIVFALIINVPMEFCYNKLLKKMRKEKLKKILSLLFGIIVFGGIFGAVIGIALPAGAKSVQSIIEQMSSGDMWEKISSSGSFGKAVVSLGDKLYHFIVNRLNSHTPQMVALAQNAVKVLLNILFGLAIAIMLLANRDKVRLQIIKLAGCIFKKEKIDRFGEVTTIAISKFSRYLGGQVIEAFILGLACYFFMLILRLPYAPLVSLIIGFVNLIPIVGAYIGGALCTIIIFAVSPIKALVFVVFILILQQLEAFTTYPIIVGRYVGLNGFWIMVSIIVWGGLFGFWGVFLGVPLTAFLHDYFKIMSEKKKAAENTAAL